MKVAVVTPTIGSKHLSECVSSVQNQTYENITHYIFNDGEEYFESIDKELKDFIDTPLSKPLRFVSLDENVGKGWYGHRVYSACSFLVNSDIICYLDEDNWYQPNHVENIVKMIEKGNDWAYSLRNIHDKNGGFVCEDNCESLGKWPTFFNNRMFHIDTSCFGVRRDVAVRIGHAWYGQWGADRQFFSAIKQHFPKYECTKEYSLNYRLDGNPDSVTEDFFIEGNKTNNERYNGKYPWTENIISTIGPGINIIE